MNAKFDIPLEKAEEVWRPLFRRYNQSLRGLRAGGFDIKAEEYWDCLRAGAEHYLFPNEEVRHLACHVNSTASYLQASTKR